MKSIKKLLPLLLILCMGLGLSACGGKGGQNDDPPDGGKVQYTVTVTCADPIAEGIKVEVQQDGTTVEVADIKRENNDEGLYRGVAVFQLEPAAYRVLLTGVPEAYTYTPRMMSASQPATTVSLTLRGSGGQTQDTVVYTVTLLYPDERPAEGVIVTICTKAGENGEGGICSPPVPTDAEGKATFELAADTYEVHIDQLYWPAGYTFDSTQYTVTPEQPSVTAYLIAATNA